MALAACTMLKDTVLAFINDDALSRGAAIAFYTVTSIAAILLIVIAIAGLVFGREAAQGAIIGQMSGLMGRQTADMLQTAIASASVKSSGILATIIGLVTLVATASGVFGENADGAECHLEGRAQRLVGDPVMSYRVWALVAADAPFQLTRAPARVYSSR
jgi:uncharacterized BrkB/YihY/UPF0761 family membrane protein